MICSRCGKNAPVETKESEDDHFYHLEVTCSACGGFYYKRDAAKE